MIAIIFFAGIAILTSESCSTDPHDDNGGNGTDTTSQNFTFETFEFGDGFSSSYFNDVWVFDENNIWAVGYISPSDTFVNGVHITNPNIIRWDGISWKLQPFSGTSSGIEGMWALDSSNIYFASGGLRKYENGSYRNITTNLGLTNGQRIERLWGSSENNIWGVGPWGTVVHYDGVSWKKIEFDRQWHFYEIVGDKETGVTYAIAMNSNFSCIIVEFKETANRIIYNSENNSQRLTAYGIEVYNNKELILSNVDIWKFNLETNGAEVFGDMEVGYYLPRVGFNSESDVYFWGNKFEHGERLVHYNGKRFTEFVLPQRNYVLYGGVSAIKDIAALAGYSDNKAYLITVRRTK